MQHLAQGATADEVEHPLPPEPAAPLWVRWLLLLLIPLIGGAIYLEGANVERTLIRLERQENPAAEAAKRFPATLAALPPLGQPRTYHKANLYEIINGHAEYYISAGFRGLAVGEYAPEGAKQPSLVVNLYHMGKPLHAFGVLMDELGGAAESVEVGEMGFREEMGVNFIVGPYYLQISSFDASIELVEAAREMAALLPQSSAEGQTPGVGFPALGEPQETFFVKEDYHGMGALDNALERTFLRDGETITAFMISGTPEEIAAIERALTAFLEQDGIPFESKGEGEERWTRVDDPYEGEWFFVPRGGRLIGLFTPPDEALLKLVLESDAPSGEE